VYVENVAGDLYLEKRDLVRRYHEVHRALRHQALDEVASRSLLRWIAKEYE
jgi:hypothetical protein